MIYDPVFGGLSGNGTWPGVFYDNDVGEKYFFGVSALCTDLSDHHWWATWSTDQYGPILRVGGAEVSIEGGQFVAMHSRIDMSYHTLGSRVSKN